MSNDAAQGPSTTPEEPPPYPSESPGLEPRPALKMDNTIKLKMRTSSGWMTSGEPVARLDC